MPDITVHYSTLVEQEPLVGCVVRSPQRVAGLASENHKPLFWKFRMDFIAEGIKQKLIQLEDGGKYIV